MDVWHFSFGFFYSPGSCSGTLGFFFVVDFFLGLEIGTACYENVMIITVQMRFAGLWLSFPKQQLPSQEETASWNYCSL